MLTKIQMIKIATEAGRTKTANELAKQMDVKKSTVQGVIYRLRKQGVNIPKTYSRNVYAEVIEELRAGHPNLFV